MEALDGAASLAVIPDACIGLHCSAAVSTADHGHRFPSTLKSNKPSNLSTAWSPDSQCSPLEVAMTWTLRLHPVASPLSPCSNYGPETLHLMRKLGHYIAERV